MLLERHERKVSAALQTLEEKNGGFCNELTKNDVM
jgi:hypothetical protein